jgi:hypothetical protein
LNLLLRWDRQVRRQVRQALLMSSNTKKLFGFPSKPIHAISSNAMIARSISSPKENLTSILSVS